MKFEQSEDKYREFIFKKNVAMSAMMDIPIKRSMGCSMISTIIGLKIVKNLAAVLQTENARPLNCAGKYSTVEKYATIKLISSENASDSTIQGTAALLSLKKKKQTAPMIASTKEIWNMRFEDTNLMIATMRTADARLALTYDIMFACIEPLKYFR